MQEKQAGFRCLSVGISFVLVLRRPWVSVTITVIAFMNTVSEATGMNPWVPCVENLGQVKELSGWQNYQSYSMASFILVVVLQI